MKNIPQHIALIMDGNRRWAKKRGLPTLVGHAKGYNGIERIVLHAKARGVKYITFWAFSTENWNRDEKEVRYLLDLFRKVFKSALVKKLLKEGGKIVVLGDLSRFPQDIQKECENLVEVSKSNSDIIVNIALNYGGRDELVHAMRKIIADKIPQEEITPELIEKYLYTKGQPDPDLLIRTGGEQRLSGYLPWQSIYSELYFTETLWPDFDEKALDKAIEDYQDRDRRFGK